MVGVTFARTRLTLSLSEGLTLALWPSGAWRHGPSMLALLSVGGCGDDGGVAAPLVVIAVCRVARMVGGRRCLSAVAGRFCAVSGCCSRTAGLSPRRSVLMAAGSSLLSLVAMGVGDGLLAVSVV